MRPRKPRLLLWLLPLIALTTLWEEKYMHVRFVQIVLLLLLQPASCLLMVHMDIFRLQAARHTVIWMQRKVMMKVELEAEFKSMGRLLNLYQVQLRPRSSSMLLELAWALGCLHIID